MRNVFEVREDSQGVLGLGLLVLFRGCSLSSPRRKVVCVVSRGNQLDMQV